MWSTRTGFTCVKGSAIASSFYIALRSQLGTSYNWEEQIGRIFCFKMYLSLSKLQLHHDAYWVAYEVAYFVSVIVLELDLILSYFSFFIQMQSKL